MADIEEKKQMERLLFSKESCYGLLLPVIENFEVFLRPEMMPRAFEWTSASTWTREIPPRKVGLSRAIAEMANPDLAKQNSLRIFERQPTEKGNFAP